MNKKAILEGLLFVVGEDGLTLDQIEEVLDIQESESHELLSSLKKDYEDEGRGIRIDFLGNRFKLTTKKEHKEFPFLNKTKHIFQKLLYISEMQYDNIV